MVIAVAIPISIIATFALMFFGGISLNQMSFGGLALGVGMIVDNAIVVLENIVRNRRQNHDRKEAALTGTSQVTGAVIASTLTTSVVFLPVVFMSNVMGILFQELAIVVVFSLLCSLFVALTLVPVLSSRFLKLKTDSEGNEILTGSQKWFQKLEEGYERLLNASIDRRRLLGGTAVALMAVSFFAIRSVPVELTPQMEADEISIRMRMDDGTNITIVNRYLEELDAIVQEIVPPNTVKFFSRDSRNTSGEIELALLPYDQLTVSPNELADQIRARVRHAIPRCPDRCSGPNRLMDLPPHLRIRRRGGSSSDADPRIRPGDVAPIGPRRRAPHGRHPRDRGCAGWRARRPAGATHPPRP